MKADFATLYRFELKKITQKKLVWIAWLLCLLGFVLTIYSMTASAYAGEGLSGMARDKAYRQALSGRPMDDALLKQMQTAYGKIPAGAVRYTQTPEYEAYARPYSDIFNYVRSWLGLSLDEVIHWETDASALYAARRETLEKEWQNLCLSEPEKEYWRSQEAALPEPMVYQYHEGYDAALGVLLTASIQILILIPACLAGLFPEEHIRKTDPLLRSTPKGKTTLYWAKVLAGITFTAISTAVNIAFIFALCIAFCGLEGFDTQLQLILDFSSAGLSAGEAVLIAYGALLVASILWAVFTMGLSVVTKNGTGTLAAAFALVVLGLFLNIPEQLAFLTRLWDWSPMCFFSTWNIFGSMMFTPFGRCIPAWQAVPVFYILAALLLALAGKILYRRSQ